MLPDKIYVKMFSYGVGYVNSSEEKLKGEGIEFIRKEALIEWAESKHNDTDNMDVRASMRMLINKLNEM